MNSKPKNLMSIAFVVLVMLFGTIFLTRCESTMGPDEDDYSFDIVDSIVNAVNHAGMDTYWHVALGSTSGTSDWAFFSDGTGRFRRSNYPATDGEDFTWTKLSSTALLVSSSYALPFTNFREISGSKSSGSFTCKLDTNDTIRTFALQSGYF
jgi:hypothetical protein